MLLCVNHQIQQIVQLYLNHYLFVDTTGVNIENYDLPQTEKLHHNNVLSKPGYVWGTIAPTFVVIGTDYNRSNSNYRNHRNPLKVCVDFEIIDKLLEDYFMKWETLVSYLSTLIIIGQYGNRRII